MSKVIKQIKKRRGVTFTSLDPIQDTILELESIYENSLDLPSIIKIALIEHKQKKINEKSLQNSQYREATKLEKISINKALREETVDYKKSKSILKKAGLEI
jgi:hypothetical protein